MKMGRWFSVLVLGAMGCLATPGPDGSAPKEDRGSHELGANPDEPELSFVSGLTCTSNEDCGRRSYCQYPIGECRGAGTCQLRMRLCAQIQAPVCGCDGKTYANACLASGVGVSLGREGQCDPGEPCGSIVCEKGLECCNAGCGICVQPGGVCTQEACD